jgi:hypothetical protein
MRYKSLVAAGVVLVASIAAADYSVIDPTKVDHSKPFPKKEWSDHLKPKLIYAEPITVFALPGYRDDITGGQRKRIDHARPYSVQFKPDGKVEPPIHRDLNGPAATPIVQGFDGIGQSSLTPPDPALGVGADGYMWQATNDVVRISDKFGNIGFETRVGPWIGDASGFYFDPKVIWDPWRQRYAILFHKQSNSPQVSELVLITGQQSGAFGSYWIYRFNAITGTGSNAAWADYYDFSYGDADALYAGGNQFRFTGGFVGSTIRTWNKSEVFSGAAAGMLTDGPALTNNDGSWADTIRIAQMQAGVSGAVDCYMINARSGGGNSITKWTMSDPLGAHNLTRVSIPVATYTTPSIAVQPGGNALDTIDCRVFNVVHHRDFANNVHPARLTFSNNTGYSGGSSIFLYVIDSQTNAVVSNLQFDDGVSDYWFGAAAADNTGYAFVCFSRTSASENVNFRFVEFNGTNWGFSNALKTSTVNNYNGYRWGDYFKGDLDWEDAFTVGYARSKTWMYGEYAATNTTYGTWVGATTSGTPGQLSVNPSGTFVTTGFQGGPFTPASQLYTASNTGQVPLHYFITGVPSWLSASSLGGRLQGGASDNITLSTNANTNALGYGVYNATVNFNTYLNTVISRSVQARVGVRVAPASYSITYGSLEGGNVASLAQSDNNRLIIRNGPVPNAALSPITYEVVGTGPTGGLGSMLIRFENQVSTSNLGQRVDVWNYSNNTWVTVIDNAGSVNTDTVTTANVPSPNNYIQAGTRQMRMRVRIRPTAPLATNNWRTRTDQLIWELNP